jgi:hypothetical protein
MRVSVMRVFVMSVALLSVVSLARPLPVAAQGTVQVYVTSAEEGSGFTSKGTDDSVLDLTKALGKKRRLAVVHSRSEADVVIEVESRDSHRELGGVYSYKDSKGKTQVYSTTKTERVVYATLRVDEYRHQFHGEGATWTSASEKVAGQVDKWVDQNLVSIIERRKR